MWVRVGNILSRVIERDTGELTANSHWTPPATTHPADSRQDRPDKPDNDTMSRDTCQRCPETSHGGAEGIRTPDLLIANETRYQLRHSPIASTYGRKAKRYHRVSGPPNPPSARVRGRAATLRAGTTVAVMNGDAADEPPWLVHAALGRFATTPGTDQGTMSGLLVLARGLPDTLVPRLEVGGDAVETTWQLPSPAVRRRHPDAANADGARFRSAPLPARTCVVELVVEDSRSGERTTLATRHVVAPGRPGSRRVEAVLDRIERLLDEPERDDAVHGQLRRALRRVPPADRGIEWDEARVLVDAVFLKNARAAHRRLRAVRDKRRAAGQDDAFAAFWTRLGSVTHPYVLVVHGYKITFASQDESAVWRETARLADQLDGLGYPSFVSYGTLLGLVREGGLIGHDDDVDLTVLLPGDTLPEVVRNWHAFKDRLADLGLLRLDYEGVPRAHCKLVAAGGLAVDVFPAWLVGTRLFAWPLTFGGLEDTDLLPLEPREVSGTAVRVPRRTEVFLETMYGPDWATPDPAHRFDWAAAKDRFEPFLTELRRAYAARR